MAPQLFLNYLICLWQKKKLNKTDAYKQYEGNISRIFVPCIRCVKFGGGGEWQKKRKNTLCSPVYTVTGSINSLWDWPQNALIWGPKALGNCIQQNYLYLSCLANWRPGNWDTLSLFHCVHDCGQWLLGQCVISCKTKYTKCTDMYVFHQIGMSTCFKSNLQGKNSAFHNLVYPFLTSLPR